MVRRGAHGAGHSSAKADLLARVALVCWQPNKRLKLAARVDYGMNLFSPRRSLSAIR
jgi:hypothetical protein